MIIKGVETLIVEERLIEHEIRKWTGRFNLNASWTLYCGDSRIAMEDIPTESINCIITSPPYFLTSSREQNSIKPIFTWFCSHNIFH